MLLPAGAGTCDLKVEMKENVVFSRRKDHVLIEMPAAKFKEWMIKYQYDPEHGKNLPMPPVPETASGQKPTGNGDNAPR